MEESESPGLWFVRLKNKSAFTIINATLHFRGAYQQQIISSFVLPFHVVYMQYDDDV